MARSRVKGAFSNRHAFRTALNMTAQDKPREEIIAHLHEKYFPNYSIDEVRKVFSPRMGFAGKITKEIDKARPNGHELSLLPPPTKREIIQNVFKLRRAMVKGVKQIKSDPVAEKKRLSAQRKKLREMHASDPQYVQRLRQGHLDFINSPRGQAYVEEASSRLAAARADPVIRQKIIDTQREAMKRIHQTDLEYIKNFREGARKYRESPRGRAYIEAWAANRRKELADPEYRAFVVERLLNGLNRYKRNKKNGNSAGLPSGRPLLGEVDLIAAPEKDIGGERSEKAHPVLATTKTPSVEADRAELAAHLDNAMVRSLSPFEQSLVKAHFGYFGKMSIEAVAKEHNLPVAEAYKIIQSALKKLSADKYLKRFQ